MAAEAVAWWGACLGVWMVTLSAFSGQEFLVASLAAIPCAALAIVARIAAEQSWAFRPRWFATAALVPVMIVRETAQVLRAAAIGYRGRFYPVEVEDSAGKGPIPRGRRATAIMLISVTPGTFVADIDEEKGEALVHVLVPGGLESARQTAR